MSVTCHDITYLLTCLFHSGVMVGHQLYVCLYACPANSQLSHNHCVLGGRVSGYY
jgi:hypothetical protein